MNVRNVDELQSAIRAGKKPTYFFFWGHQPEKDGRIGKSCLSHWWPASFTVDGLTYPSAEHFMMAEKARLFGDSATQEKIIAAPDPSTAKRLSREVQGFDQTTWNKAKFEVVVCGNLHKFGQDKQLRSFLLSTDPRVLVETLSKDTLWGIGLPPTDVRTRNPEEWKGQNLLGFALMEVRERLANAA
ncbi:MAG TPA: NADAR family protein [Thermoanaerobaculia bacterium]|jgi:hypothetical protein|nr:NADAR family protein [Thermoanaerobaculia bacterium]